MAQTHAHPGPARPARHRLARPSPATPGSASAACCCCIATFIVVAAPVDVRARPAGPGHQGAHRPRLRGVGPTSLMLCSRGSAYPSPTSRSRPPPGMGGEPTLRAQTLEAELSPAVPLVAAGRRQARSCSRGRSIELHVDAQGRRSWDFAAAEAGRVRVAQAGTRQSTGRACGAPRQDAELAAALEKLLPTSVTIVDGTVRYVDERPGVRHEVGSTRARSCRRPTSTARSRPRATSPGAARSWSSTAPCRRSALALEEQKAGLTFKLVGPAHGGQLRRHARRCRRADRSNGLLSLKAPSVQTLASWIGRPMTAGQDPGALSLSSFASSSADGRVSLSRLTATLGDTSLDGCADHRDQGRASPPQRQSAPLGARPRPHAHARPVPRRRVRRLRPAARPQADPVVR